MRSLYRGCALASLLVVTGCAGASHPTASAPTRHAAATNPSPPSSSSTNAQRTQRLRASTLLHLPVGVSRSVVVADGGRLLVLGGLAPGDSSTSRVWSVDVHRRTTTAAGHLAVAVHDASGAVLHGHVFVFGGGAATTVATVQEWNAGVAHVVGSLPQPRSDSSSAVIGSTAYVVGGFDGQHMDRDVVATTDGVHFRVVARLRVGVRYAAVAAVGHDLFVGGGALATTEGTASGPTTSDVQRVDTLTGRVDVVAKLPHQIAHAVGVVADGMPCVAGGRTSAGAASSVYSVTPNVTILGRLPRAISDAGAAVIGSTTYVVGGEKSGPYDLSDAVVAIAT